MMKFLFIFAVGVLFGQAVCRPDGDGTNDITVHWIPFERAPYMALVHVNEDPKCGASILQEQFVLTAAHCCQHPIYQIKVLVGAERIRNGLFVSIDRAIVHEKYDTLNKDYNICLIKLREPLTFGPTIAKIALADKHMDLSSGVSVNATGWGGYHIGDPLMLLQVEMPLSANQRCRKIHKWTMTERMICAGQSDSNACPTGAGNPLTVGGVQVGLLSWGAVCFRPAIHTNVAALGDWVRGQMLQLQ